MPTCIVPGCTSGYKTNPGKFHFFTIPRNPVSLELWRRAVKRDDVKSGHSVCENHFSKNEILWQRHILGRNGCVLGISPYRVPRLVKGVVPSIFPWIEEDISSKITTPLQAHRNLALQPQSEKQEDNLADNSDGCPLQQKRQKVDDGNRENHNTTISSLIKLHQREFDCQESEEPLDCLKNQDQINCQESIATSVSSSTGRENTSSVSLTFDKLLATQIKLPPRWLMQKTTCESTKLIILLTTRCINLENVYKTFVLKAVTVTDDLSIQVTVLDKLIKPLEWNLPDRVTNTTQLEEFLSTIDTMKVCKGCTSSTIETQIKNVNCRSVSKDITETYRHHECSLLLSGIKSCQSCRRAQKTLATKLRRWKSGANKTKYNGAPKSPIQKKEFIRLREKLRAAEVSKAKALEKCKSLQGRLKICQARMARCADLDPDKLLKSGKVSENQVHALQQIIDAAKRKNSKGRNYSEEWMLLCRLLYMRSSSGYEFLRSNDVLPLPCLRTIRRNLPEINSQYGSNKQFFEIFKTALEKNDESQKHGACNSTVGASKLNN